MIVMKFGGTSVENAACINRVIEIVRGRLPKQPVVVVSAMGKTTQGLLDAAEASARGDAITTLKIVEKLRSTHFEEAGSLLSGVSLDEISGLIEQSFGDLKKLLEGLAILGEVPPRGLDKILAYGELLSSFILTGALKEKGIDAELMDARLFIRTDDRYGSASPDFPLTDAAIREFVLPPLGLNKVPVIQGFIGSTPEGATTTLGFEGSDYTAAIVAAALGADDVEIWKDVPGLMTADPAICKIALTVRRCSYDEAAELTYFGAKVLHHKAVYPVAARNIPVHIYNSKNAAANGTEISLDAGPCNNLVKSIAYKRPVTVVKLEVSSGDSPSASQGQDRLLMAIDAFASKRIPRILTAASESGATIVVDSNVLSGSKERYIIDRLSSIGRITIESGRAIISMIGEGLQGMAGLDGHLVSMISASRPQMILHGPSARTVSIVVGEAEVEDVIGALHREIFAETDPRVFC